MSELEKVDDIKVKEYKTDGIKPKEREKKKIEDEIKPRENKGIEKDLEDKSNSNLGKEAEDRNDEIKLKRSKEIEVLIEELEEKERKLEILKAYKFMYIEGKEENEKQIKLIYEKLEEEKKNSLYKDIVEELKIKIKELEKEKETIEKELVNIKRDETIRLNEELQKQLSEILKRRDEKYEKIKEEKKEVEEKLETIEMKLKITSGGLLLKERSIKEIYIKIDIFFSEIVKLHGGNLEKEKVKMNVVMRNMMDLKRFFSGVETEYNYIGGIEIIIKELRELEVKFKSIRVNEIIKKLEEL